MPRLLLVEDNEFNRDMLSRRLQRKGFDVIIDEDGERGILLAPETRPHLILIDMDLPVLDGWEATRRLNSDPLTSSIPVVALTAHAMKSDHDRAMASGCDDFATKPIEFAVLLDKITRALGGGSAPLK